MINNIIFENSMSHLSENLWTKIFVLGSSIKWENVPLEWKTTNRKVLSVFGRVFKWESFSIDWWYCIWVINVWFEWEFLIMCLKHQSNDKFIQSNDAMFNRVKRMSNKVEMF